MTGTTKDVDILESAGLAYALMSAIYVATAKPDLGPHRWHETEKKLRAALHEYAKEIVRAARAGRAA